MTEGGDESQGDEMKEQDSFYIYYIILYFYIQLVYCGFSLLNLK